jgi:6-phosphogluconolactonase
MKVRQSVNMRVFRVRAQRERSIEGWVFPSGHEVALEAANRVAAAARDAIAARGSFSIALAGGRTPALLHRTLAGFALPDWAHWEIFFGDERCVPADDPRSNYGSALHDLLAPAAIPTARVHPMYQPGRDLDALAAEYDRLLVDRLGPAPVLDMLVLGLGHDTHTLSLHPGCAALDERERNVVALVDPPMDPAVSRLTLTPPMVRRARQVLLLATGVEKSDAVFEMLEGAYDPTEEPAQIIRECEGEVVVLLDDDAFDGIPAA